MTEIMDNVTGLAFPTEVVSEVWLVTIHDSDFKRDFTGIAADIPTAKAMAAAEVSDYFGREIEWEGDERIVTGRFWDTAYAQGFVTMGLAPVVKLA